VLVSPPGLRPVAGFVNYVLGAKPPFRRWSLTVPENRSREFLLAANRPPPPPSERTNRVPPKRNVATDQRIKHPSRDGFIELGRLLREWFFLLFAEDLAARDLFRIEKPYGAGETIFP